MPGDNEKELRVPLVYDTRWDITREFGVELLTEDRVGATLSRYLWKARVKVIEADVFPSNVYAEDVKERRMHEVSTASLQWDYIRLDFSVTDVKRGSIKVMITDQLHNPSNLEVGAHHCFGGRDFVSRAR